MRCPSTLYDSAVAKRLTLVSTEERISAPEKADERSVVKTDERRKAQRRLSIGRRLQERRSPETPPESERDEQRRPNERRGLAQRRRLLDRRSGIRLLDLTNIDLSELDS